MADKGSKKKTGLTLACVILALLVIFIIFLVKKDSIITNLKETRFFERVFGSTPEFVENHVPSEKAAAKNDTITIQIEQPPVHEPEPPVTTREDKEPEKPAATSAKPQPEKPENTGKPVQNAYTTLQLCFVEIDPEGSINRKLIKRSVPKNDSPLTQAINLLLQGPDTTKSEEKNCTSLIPSGVKLLGVKISDGVAYLDFNDSFEINTNGVEGYNAQLMQIVYTATTFSTVNSVQFLIEGKKKEYLGSEGQWIGSPLTRNSF